MKFERCSFIQLSIISFVKLTKKFYIKRKYTQIFSFYIKSIVIKNNKEMKDNKEQNKNIKTERHTKWLICDFLKSTKNSSPCSQVSEWFTYFFVYTKFQLDILPRFAMKNLNRQTKLVCQRTPWSNFYHYSARSVVLNNSVVDLNLKHEK